MKLYKMIKRAVAYELCDLHSRPADPIYYPWYDEDKFPNDMEKIVKKDNPFGGWYTYYEQSKFVLVKDTECEQPS